MATPKLSKLEFQIMEALWAKAEADSTEKRNSGRIANIKCFLTVLKVHVIAARRPSLALVPRIHPKTTQY